MNRESKKHCIAIVLAAGQGKRMGTAVQKQYIELDGRPVIYYTLRTFEASDIIDEIVLVVGADQVEYVRKEIVEAYQISKVSTIVPGGSERYESVWRGLESIADQDAYVFIHDGARMCVDEGILERGYESVEKYRACVAGMPSKDTVKTVDTENWVTDTPDRRYVWTVQTPQVFELSLIKDAYSRIIGEDCKDVTDDAMVVERTMDVPIKLFKGSYKNLKITTPEDLDIAKVFSKMLENRS